MNNDVDSNQHEIEFPNHVIISLARLFLLEIQKYYNSDDGKKFLAQWDNKNKKLRSSREA